MKTHNNAHSAQFYTPKSESDLLMNMKTHNCSEERQAKVGTSTSVLIKRQHACKQEGHRDVKSSRNPGPEYLCDTQTDTDIPLTPDTRNLKPRKRVTKYVTVTVKSLDQHQAH